jgi:hypothetical protein
MSQNQMKWLATLLILVDRIGFLLEAEPMRIIGRLSFPLFAWIFAQNWKRRENASAKPLITRLVLFGILAKIPYILLFMNLNLNILISLAVAGITFSQIHKSSKKNLMLTVGLITAQLLGVSYGWYAVACPLLMINLKGAGDRMWWVGWIVTNVIYTITCNSAIQIFAIFTPLILAYHNRPKTESQRKLKKNSSITFIPSISRD